mmetsp:Transcript_35888/g.89420  ORF Transcript_35888/g.89420 Transcript_35888/m.89420 type:complete len:233 (+) Transcript_35888:1248-1946(+)
MRPTFASLTKLRPPAERTTFCCVNTSPSTSSVSSTVPPSFLTTRMSFRSTLSGLAGSKAFMTASTAIGASCAAFWLTTFELSDVAAFLMRTSLSFRSTDVDISRRISTDLFDACRNASAIACGWSPLLRSISAAPSSAPAMTTTDVVPSPASTSCALDNSTNILAVGCCTAICLSMVAPSLVITTPSLASWIILSMPLGPRLVRMASATALAATMFCRLTSFVFSFLLSCSP